MLLLAAKDFCKACREGNAESALHLLTSYIRPVQEAMIRKDSALYLAAISISSAVIRMLLDRCMARSEQAMLMQKGLQMPHSTTNKSPLQICFELGYIDIITDLYRTDLRLISRNTEMQLIALAVMNNHVGICKLMLKKILDPVTGKSRLFGSVQAARVLIYACEQPELIIFYLLLPYCNASDLIYRESSDSIYCALYNVCDQRDLSMLGSLLKSFPPLPAGLLHVTIIATGNIVCVKYFLENGGKAMLNHLYSYLGVKRKLYSFDLCRRLGLVDIGLLLIAHGVKQETPYKPNNVEIYPDYWIGNTSVVSAEFLASTAEMRMLVEAGTCFSSPALPLRSFKEFNFHYSFTLCCELDAFIDPTMSRRILERACSFQKEFSSLTVIHTLLEYHGINCCNKSFCFPFLEASGYGQKVCQEKIHLLFSLMEIVEFNYDFHSLAECMSYACITQSFELAEAILAKYVRPDILAGLYGVPFKVNCSGFCFVGLILRDGKDANKQFKVTYMGFHR